MSGRAWLAIRDRLVALHGQRDAFFAVSSSVKVADKGEHSFAISAENSCVNSLVSVPAYIGATLLAWDWLYLIWLQAMSYGVIIPLKKRYTAGGNGIV